MGPEIWNLIKATASIWVFPLFSDNKVKANEIWVKMWATLVFKMPDNIHLSVWIYHR